MTRVLAVTTSLGTRWESYSQALIAHHLPQWKRMVVNGRRNWSPTAFIERALERESDFIVHVDEDCFIQSASGIEEVFGQFERDPRLVAAGIPDGGHYYRARNPAALNLFFVVFRTSALRAAWSRRDGWASVAYRPEYGDEVLQELPQIDRSRIDWNNPEPYYPLFWTLLEQGGRFMYLPNELDRSRWSTTVLAQSRQPIAEHLWYLREWFKEQPFPGHDCSNASRYRAFERALREREGGLHFRTLVGAMNAKRLVRRVFA